MAIEAAVTTHIVVGFDGSEGAHLAVQWALDEAERRHGCLTVVQAWKPTDLGTDEEWQDYTEESLQQEVKSLVGNRPVPWQVRAEYGPAAKVLLRHAQGADMLVVGARGHDGFPGLLLGSVGIDAATYATTPAVVIVRAPT